MVWDFSSNSWKIDFFSPPPRAKFALHRTHLKLAEYATDKESIILIISWAYLGNFKKKPLFWWPTMQKFGHKLLRCRISTTHQKHYKADDLSRTALILRNGVFLPPTIKKIRSATYCPKTSRICYTHQKHLKVDNLRRSPQLLTNPVFLSWARTRPKRAEHATDTERILKPIVWAVSSNCWKSTFPGTPKSKVTVH